MRTCLMSALFFENLLLSLAPSLFPSLYLFSDLLLTFRTHSYGLLLYSLVELLSSEFILFASQMINMERNGNGVGIGGTGTPAHDKQLPAPPKKAALRDVQNENVGLMHKQQENLLPGGGKSSSDVIKVSGNKRLTPEHPSSFQGLPSLAYNGANENIMNARRRFELELGRGRLPNNVEKYSDGLQSRSIGQSPQEIPQKPAQTRDNNLHHVAVAKSTNMTPIMAFSSCGPSVPSSLIKHNNSNQAAKVSSEPSHMVEIKSTNDQLRTERFIRLQKFLKHCDEAYQKEYIQMLLHLSPAELSKRAVELEKRAIQLTIEEGNEMQRMKALNILGKSSSMSTSLQSTQLLQANK